jgi:hypothetical protein
MKPTYWMILSLFLAACQEKYMPKITTPAAGYLVVEGFINVNGTTNIQMSRSSGIDSPAYIPEPGAEVDVQYPNGPVYPLTEMYPGFYSVSGLNIDPSQQYQLHIRTSNGKDYLSDLAKVNITPPIDSLSWSANGSGVTVYVNTHNSQVQPGYYQWQYEETWKYTSAYESTLIYSNGSMNIRPDSDYIFTCWRSDLSTSVIIANTEKLSANVIYQFPVAYIPYAASNKLISQYSILVSQTSLTADWYEWNQEVQANTEQVGTIFDAQPSETGGNIHCTTDPTERVIGFIGVTSQTQMRIFIDRNQLPVVNIPSGYESCVEDSVGLDAQDLEANFSAGNFLPVQYIYKNGFAVGVQASDFECVDCRAAGGTTVKPSYWP